MSENRSQANGQDSSSVAKAKELVDVFRKKFEAAKREKFTFLLVGRTGVGKSSTINTLMAKQVAQVGDWVPTTMSVESYDSDALGIKFTVIDTPGLCDELEEVGNDEKYLELIRSKVKQFDCMWFVTRLNETRITSDEKRGIKLITESFGPEVWEHAIIVFTFSCSVNMLKYSIALEKRTELIRAEIAKYSSEKIANSVPSVTVDNESKTTPDGSEWLGELYTRVFTRMSDRGLMSFFAATAHRLNTPKRRSHKSGGGSTGLPKPSGDTPASAGASDPRINLTDRQTKEIQKRIDASIIPGAALVGATIGSAFGPAGIVVGGVAGAVIGTIAWFWD